jgi:hypothetical protein
MNQSWMSRHATEHKSNLLNEMPVDNKASALNMEKVVKAQPALRDVKIEPKVPKKKIIKTGLVEPKRQQPRQIRQPEPLRERKVQKGEILPKEKFNIGVNMNDNSPMSKLGCGGKGCVIKRGDQWVILNNKKAGYPVWRSGFKSEADAKKMLSAYHANS